MKVIVEGWGIIRPSVSGGPYGVEESPVVERPLFLCNILHRRRFKDDATLVGSPSYHGSDLGVTIMAQL